MGRKREENVCLNFLGVLFVGMEILMWFVFDLWLVEYCKTLFIYSYCPVYSFGLWFKLFSPGSCVAVALSLGYCAKWDHTAKPQIYLLFDPLHCSCGTADSEARYWNPTVTVEFLGWVTVHGAMSLASTGRWDSCDTGRRREVCFLCSKEKLPVLM